MNDKLDEAIEWLDLEAWLDQYTELKHGGGAERRVESCPKCANDEYKLYVNCDMKRWICYVCGWGRGLADVVVLMSAISNRTLFDIRKELLLSVRPAPGGDLQQQLNAAWEPPQEPAVVAPDVVLPGTDKFDGLTASRVREYILSRGITEHELQLYRFRAALKLRRFTGPFALIPVMFKNRCVAWQGRNINNVTEAKYVSSDGIAEWLWPIDDAFLAAISYWKRVTLVEGTYDAEGMWRINEPTFCTFGKSISKAQIELLRSFGVRDVAVAWDADAAVTSDKKLARQTLHDKHRRGLRGEIEDAALRLRQHFNASVVDLSNPPPFEGVKKADPGEILRSPAVGAWVKERLARAINVNSLEFFQWQLGGVNG